MLIKEADEIKAKGWDWQGETSHDTAVLHAEFEGAGVYDLLLACLAALAIAVIGVIICHIPIFGWIACLILALIAAAVVGIGMAVALNDKGNPNDVNANLGSLEKGKDILVVQGSWVYDSAHEGWNELHPIKHCQRIGTWTGHWEDQFKLLPPGVPQDVQSYVKHWCDAISAANDPAVGTAQGDLKNQWEVHPVIDGCDPGTADGGDGPPIIR